MAAINKIKERPQHWFDNSKRGHKGAKPLHHKPLVIIKKPNAKRKKGEKKKETDKCLRTWHHCGRSDHYVTLVWSSDLKRSNGSEGTNTHRLPAIDVCSTVQELICRACTRLFTRGLSRALLCYRYLSESSTSLAKKLFPTVSFALRGKS